MDKKQKIAEFIESIVDGEVDSNAILMGGAVKEPDGINATTNGENGGMCTNRSYVSCNMSKNHSGCQNASGCCDSSSNSGGCDNDFHPSMNTSWPACQS